MGEGFTKAMYVRDPMIPVPGGAIIGRTAVRVRRTAERLTAAGVEVVTIPYDELHPNGGGVHCSTMELIREPAS